MKQLSHLHLSGQINLFIQHIFIEYLMCDRDFSRCWVHGQVKEVTQGGQGVSERLVTNLSTRFSNMEFMDGLVKSSVCGVVGQKTE